ncbi:radical SAM protein [Iamia majanohamensis]|uniref:Radical SAM protein n=1 Tax=Iamia majanohamensis TaxID=467976 RepID=A0AAF0BXR1_9ACTN|nr:radical SAM protein [Iamia majanohamensis]WCO69248.1 radical SAM protein [Iamia majanohamensis]
MRILFWYRGIENLGVGYLMSMLKHHGHQVDLIFEPGLDDNGYVKVPGGAWFNRPEALMERARAFDPHLVAIGSPTNLWPHAAAAAERLKRELDVPVVVGGHHAQALPEWILGHDFVDVVCTGEGELALLELVERMSRGEDYTDVPTMWVKQDGVIHRNEIGLLENDLDRFPFPEKELWREYGAFRDSLEVFTGRGCPFKCTFCNIHYQREIFEDKGDFLRKRSVANVIAELEENLRRYDVKTVAIHDDNFTTNVLWVEEFCDVYRDKIGLPWFCFGYPTTLKPRVLSAMKSANCSILFMGIDSGDADVRKTLMERPMTDDLIVGKGELLHEHDIDIFASTVFGTPGETDVQMMKTLDMARRVDPMQCSGNVFYPLPKTKLYDLAVEMGYLDEEGEEKVRQGRSSFHHESILDHPHKELAETLAQITPIYAKAPEWALPALRWMVARRMKRAAKALYLVLIPITFPHVGRDGIKITVSMATKAVRLKARTRARRRDRWRGVPATPPPPRVESERERTSVPRRARIPVAVEHAPAPDPDPAHAAG